MRGGMPARRAISVVSQMSSDLESEDPSHLNPDPSHPNPDPSHREPGVRGPPLP